MAYVGVDYIPELGVYADVSLTFLFKSETKLIRQLSNE
jgi:hypothetical protein